jgi:hypothetical protein
MAELRVVIRGLDAAKTELGNDFKRFVNQIKTELHQSLIDHTPVRSGRARAGWQTKTRSNSSFEEVNRVPYIERLEKNWSKQTRGRGIIGPALNNVKGKFK